MMEDKREKNGFEAREALGPDYWRDIRWARVRRLRTEEDHHQANALVMEIRRDWGLE